MARAVRSASRLDRHKPAQREASKSQEEAAGGDASERAPAGASTSGATFLGIDATIAFDVALAIIAVAILVILVTSGGGHGT